MFSLMDSSAYLTRHGWRGEGHALHPSGRGIKKALLVSKKPNVLGVGIKKNDIHADQWWARAFDNGLKNLGVADSKDKTFVASANVSSVSSLQQVGVHCGKWSGLYNRFVRGPEMEGTLDSHSKFAAPVEILQQSQKLKTPGESETPVGVVSGVYTTPKPHMAHRSSKAERQLRRRSKLLQEPGSATAGDTREARVSKTRAPHKHNPSI